ncbi:MAG: polysaccharide pyruvyl transferase family protein [Planctomycetota bacterium]
MEKLHDQTLRDLFQAHRNRRFFMVESGGNAGDGLIVAGADFLARSEGLDTVSLTLTEFDETKVGPDDAVYIHGGGGYNPWCSGRVAESLRRAVRSEAALVIQGPQSYDDRESYTSRILPEILADAKVAEIHLFVRENTSLELLKKVDTRGARVGMDVDTALQLTAEEFRRMAGIDEGRYHLLALREDNEAPGEIAIQAEGVRLDPARFARSFPHWLRIHAAAKTIHANRTHSAVAGAILGVPTTLYAGSYHKNRSIWEHSLRDRGVIWGEYREVRQPPDAAATPQPDAGLGGTIGRVRNSWKVRQVIDRLRRIRFRMRGVPFQ